MNGYFCLNLHDYIVMKLRFIIRQLFVLMVAVVTIDVTSAQELDYDYRAYKYYDEDGTTPLYDTIPD